MWFISLNLVGRRREKDQLKKNGGIEFCDVNLSYIYNEGQSEHFVSIHESCQWR